MRGDISHASMFITIPLLFVTGALLALGFVIWRKWPFLKKLEPDAHAVGDSFVHDLAPEAVERARAVHWRSLWHHVLQGIEEMLNVIRSAFHAVGRASDRLRSSVQSVKRSVPEPQSVQEPYEPEAPQVVVPQKDDQAEQERLLKEEEQRLILDIAQDPKNVNLYVALGKVYSKLGNITDAIESFKTAGKLDPDDPSIKERLNRAEDRLERETEKAEKEKEIEKHKQEAEQDSEEHSDEKTE